MNRKANIRIGRIVLCSLILLTGCGNRNLDPELSEEPQRDVLWEEIETEEDAQTEQDETEEESSADDETKELQRDAIEKEDGGEEEEETPSETEEETVKRISIVGDSISTFEGWMPGGYSIFFPLYGEITDVSQTWWKPLLDDMGLQLCANSSSSGSTCVGNSLSTDDPQCGCDNFRIEGAIGAGGIHPDIIIVYMGTNDVVTHVPLGTNDGTHSVEEGVIDNFSDAYKLMLDKLEAQYPGAQIICCTLTPLGGWTEEGELIPFVNKLGLTDADYSRQIEAIAGEKGFPVVDLQSCGMSIDNLLQYVTDGVHPNPEGMKLIGKAVRPVIEECCQ